MQQFNRISDYPPEKLPGKLLGKFRPWFFLTFSVPMALSVRTLTQASSK
jgi:hypothetical protein